MTHERQDAEIPDQAEENRRIWDANAGFVVDGSEEPGFPEPEQRRAGVRWDDMPGIPPVMVVRMRLSQGGQSSATRDA